MRSDIVIVGGGPAGLAAAIAAAKENSKLDILILERGWMMGMLRLGVLTVSLPTPERRQALAAKTAAPAMQ